jgi:hypothetical protein
MLSIFLCVAAREVVHLSGARINLFIVTTECEMVINGGTILLLHVCAEAAASVENDRQRHTIQL